jgi:hypothetical protein
VRSFENERFFDVVVGLLNLYLIENVDYEGFVKGEIFGIDPEQVPVECFKTLPRNHTKHTIMAGYGVCEIDQK